MAKEIKSVGIVGAGFTGKQIAAQTAQNNFVVKVYDSNPKSVEDAKKYITGVLKRKNLMDAIQDVSYYSDLDKALKDVDLVIEAVPENLALKKKIFSQIDNLAPAHTIIGTNSSSYPVSKIESAVKRKDKVLNLHFYPPIPTRPMVDIMRGSETSEETFEIGKKWIEDIKCEPLVVNKECLGFVFNRIWHTVKKECLKIWDGGYADIKTVDTAWKIFTGMKMGPFTMMDGIGLDVAYAVEMSYYGESGDLNDKPPDAFKELVENGDLGLKTGKGFYTYRRRKK
ncbi:MAG: 3-hydroxyacyl-CoA dehydrogenase family protein [Candidatus Lokiarchaeota archaeon]|nr:3-hydroxyacyl-CoA dehydrogenase family protein [Candidatus Lokiarchaeota archaeon]